LSTDATDFRPISGPEGVLGLGSSFFFTLPYSAPEPAAL